MISLWVAYSVRDVLMLIYVSALFAVVLSPAIGMIQKIHIGSWRAGRGFAIVFLILMLPWRDSLCFSRSLRFIAMAAIFRGLAPAHGTH